MRLASCIMQGSVGLCRGEGDGEPEGGAFGGGLDFEVAAQGFDAFVDIADPHSILFCVRDPFSIIGYQ